MGCTTFYKALKKTDILKIYINIYTNIKESGKKSEDKENKYYLLILCQCKLYSVNKRNSYCV